MEGTLKATTYCRQKDKMTRFEGTYYLFYVHTHRFYYSYNYNSFSKITTIITLNYCD